MLRSIRSFIPLFLLVGVLAFAALPTGTTQAQTAQRCFPETGFCIEGRIRTFWEQNGGLMVFGFPIGPQKEEQIEGKSYQVQRFERNRLELHPENKAPYDVLLGRLGADRIAQQGRDWNTFPKSGNQGACRFFPETNQSVCGAILSAWRANGLEIDGKRGKSEAENLALFGLPLSGLMTEKLSDGKEYQVQWFERARFELHPENKAPYDVLLGLLGNEIRDGAGTTPIDPPSDIPAGQNAVAIPNSGASGTLFHFVATGFQPGENIGVYITLPDRSVFGAPFQTTANDAGVSDSVSYNTRGLGAIPLGFWAITFEGTTSGHKAVAYFEILPGEVTGGTAQANPASGSRTTRFTFTASGFRPGERVGVYITGPDGGVLGAPFQLDADGQGAVEEVYFDAAVFSDIPTGRWAISFEGLSSGVKAIAYFEITP